MANRVPRLDLSRLGDLQRNQLNQKYNSSSSFEDDSIQSVKEAASPYLNTDSPSAPKESYQERETKVLSLKRSDSEEFEYFTSYLPINNGVVVSKQAFLKPKKSNNFF